MPGTLAIRNMRAMSVALMFLICGCGSSFSAATSSTPSIAEATPSTVKPISGYGDFSGEDYFNVDWYEVTRLQVACLNDHGFPVTLIPPGDGISFASIPPEQSQAADATLEACRTGMNLPAPRPPDADELEKIYEWMLVVASCLETEGFTIPEPPTLEVFTDRYLFDGWNPYEFVDPSNEMSVSEWNALNVACPQQEPSD